MFGVFSHGWPAQPRVVPAQLVGHDEEDVHRRLRRWPRPRRRVPGRHVRRRALDVPGLVVEEEVGLELAQELALASLPRNIASSTAMFQPINVRDRARSCARRARRDERSADAHAARRLALHPVQRLEQRRTGPKASGVAARSSSWSLEGVEAVALEHALGLVGEQHRVAVEGDAHLVRVRVRRAAGADRRAPRARRPSAERTSASFVDRNRLAASGRR